MKNLQYLRLYFPNGKFTYVHIWNRIDLNNCLKLN